MKVYKIKHKPTGLYYSPSPARLTRCGKLYQRAANMLSYYTNELISVRIDYSYRKLFEGYETKFGGQVVYIPRTEFEIEYV